MKGNTGLIIVVVAAVVLLIGGFVFYTNRQNQLEPAVEMKQVDMSEGKNMMVEKDETMVMEDDMKLSIMENPDSLSGTLKDVAGGNSSGTAYVLGRDGKLSHTVTANLPDPSGGNVYEGWLVNKTPSLTFFSTGVMEKQADETYTLSFMADKLFEGYNFVVITEETVVDSTPETHILEGTVN
ncbi:anti-sigma factor [Patescibacteria group bacterium]|nr:anti-sigma factor [Patescibacteria group bacterium]